MELQQKQKEQNSLPLQPHPSINIEGTESMIQQLKGEMKNSQENFQTLTHQKNLLQPQVGKIKEQTEENNCSDNKSLSIKIQVFQVKSEESSMDRSILPKEKQTEKQQKNQQKEEQLEYKIQKVLKELEHREEQKKKDQNIQLQSHKNEFKPIEQQNFSLTGINRLIEQNTQQISEQIEIPIQDKQKYLDNNFTTHKKKEEPIKIIEPLQLVQRSRSQNSNDKQYIDTIRKVKLRNSHKRKSLEESQSSEQSPSYSDKSQESDYEDFKQWKRKKKAKSLKFLIKKVQTLEKKVKHLKKEKQQARVDRKSSLIKLERKSIGRGSQLSQVSQMRLKSNIMNIKLDNQDLRVKQNIVSELKLLRQKVDNLENKSNHQERPQSNFGGSSYCKQQNLFELQQHSTKKQTGKIFKKNQNNFVQESESSDVNEIRNQPKKHIGDAITLQKQMSKKNIQLKSNVYDNFEIQEKPKITLEKKQENMSRDFRNYSRQFSNFQKHYEPQQQLKFKRSGHNIPNIQRSKEDSRTEWQESLKMLEFDTGKEKFIIDSKDTDEDKDRETTKKGNGFSFSQAQRLLPGNLTLPSIPSPNSQEEDLIVLGKQLFEKFGVDKIKDDKTVLTVKKYKNCVYFGVDPENNILVYYDAKVYFGGWKTYNNGEGQKYGEGIEFQENRFQYKGQFNEGKRNGYGVIKTWNNNHKISIYAGQFFEGLKNGKGKQVDQQGIFYEGEWKQGRKDGFGRLVINDYQFYEGTFEKGLKSGHGTQYFKNGDQYKGEYAFGKFNSKGRYYWANGSVFQGQFRNGMRNGMGIWRSKTAGGDVYEGYYENDMKHGKGTYKWGNGSCYKGYFKDDQKHGKGEIRYDNGKVSKLEWQNGNVIRKLEDSEKMDFNASQIKSASKTIHFKKTDPSIRNRGSERKIDNKALSDRGIKKGRYEEKRHFQQEEKETFQRNNEGRERKTFHQIAQRPMTSKSSQFRLERKSVSGKSAPQDPPYRGIRPSTNIMHF